MGYCCIERVVQVDVIVQCSSILVQTLCPYLYFPDQILVLGGGGEVTSAPQIFRHIGWLYTNPYFNRPYRWDTADP
jgi:hypothetical protein